MVTVMQTDQTTVWFLLASIKGLWVGCFGIPHQLASSQCLYVGEDTTTNAAWETALATLSGTSNIPVSRLSLAAWSHVTN